MDNTSGNNDEVESTEVNRRLRYKNLVEKILENRKQLGVTAKGALLDESGKPLPKATIRRIVKHVVGIHKGPPPTGTLMFRKRMMNNVEIKNCLLNVTKTEETQTEEMITKDENCVPRINETSSNSMMNYYVSSVTAPIVVTHSFVLQPMPTSAKQD